MIEKSDTQNKAILSKRKAKEEGSKKPFFYPDHSITIEADSREEADKKLNEHINK